MTASHVYHLAEAYRLFECDALKSVRDQVDSLFRNDVNKISKASSLHYAYLLNADAKSYGQAGSIENFLSGRVNDQLLKNFDQTDFGLEGSQRPDGISLDSLRALDIFSSLQKSPEVGTKTSAIVSKFIERISKQTVAEGDHVSFFSQSLTHGDLTPA